MPKISTKALLICLALMMAVTCASCKTDAFIEVSEYLEILALKSGIGISDDDYLPSLENWGVVTKEDGIQMNDYLRYDYLCTTIGRLMEADSDYFTFLKNKSFISSSAKKKAKVSRTDAINVIDLAVKYINNKQLHNNLEETFKDEIKDLEDDDLEKGDIVYDSGNNTYKIVEEKNTEGYEFREAEYDEVFEAQEVECSYAIDFSQAEVIPYGEEEDEIYVNNLYNLLASRNHSFYNEGFRISYTLNTAGIDIHISKDVNGMNVYGDLSIANVKPTLKWSQKEGDFANCYFKIDLNTNERIGVSDGKYLNYYLDFKDLDSSSFMAKLNSLVKPYDDEVEASNPISKIKTPIPSIPSAYLNFDVLIKLYVSGKVELSLANSHSLGFETKNGIMRIISDYDHDVDAIAKASGKAAFGLNVNVEALQAVLMDVELDTGVKAELKTTVHLYDEEGNKKETESEIAYGTLESIAKENSDVKVCGDVSLYWLMDLVFNTSKTKLYKYGFNKTIHILDEDTRFSAICIILKMANSSRPVPARTDCRSKKAVQSLLTRSL